MYKLDWIKNKLKIKKESMKKMKGGRSDHRGGKTCALYVPNPSLTSSVSNFQEFPRRNHLEVPSTTDTVNYHGLRL